MTDRFAHAVDSITVCKGAFEWTSPAPAFGAMASDQKMPLIFRRDKEITASKTTGARLIGPEPRRSRTRSDGAVCVVVIRGYLWKIGNVALFVLSSHTLRHV